MSYSNKFIIKMKVVEIIPTQTNFVGILGIKQRKVGKKFKKEMIVLNCFKEYVEANNIQIGRTVMIQFFVRTQERQSNGNRWFNTSLIVQKIVVVK